MTTTGTVHAVVTNDEGLGSEGLRMLAYAAVQAGWDVVVAAPDRQASGTGAAMTAVQADGQVIVERYRLPLDRNCPRPRRPGRPGFIAFTAVPGAFGRRPDYLLSGINLGPNTGKAVLPSGTVGAAMTAATYGVRAAAFSLDVSDAADAEHWRPASDVAGGSCRLCATFRPALSSTSTCPLHRGAGSKESARPVSPTPGQWN